MAGRLWYYRGGIFRVLEEVEQFEDAIRFDLLKLGLDLDEIGRGRTTWVHLRAFISSSDNTTAYAFAKHGDIALWDVHAELLATLIDTTNLRRWEAGGSNGKRPPLISRPGQKDNKSFGVGESWTPESLDQWIEIMETGAAT